jgi:VWA domain-containing protein
VFFIRPLVATALLAIALSGCASTEMAPVAMPSRPAQLKLCTQSPIAPPHDLASNSNFVEFSVDVVDSTGAETRGLAQSDFVAMEGDRPIPIAYFREEQGRPPVSIGILVDKSGSMVTKLPMVHSSLDALLSKVDPCDEVFLFAFGMDPILVEDFTTDHALVSQRMSLVGAGDQTPFYDGVQQGIALLNASHYRDRVIIIFTDDLGSLDNASKRAKRDDLVSSALNSHDRYFVVGVGKPDATAHPITVGIGPWAFGPAPNGVGAEDLGKLATELGAEFFLITGEPDANAPKVSARNRNASVASPPEYPPLAADPGELQRFATSFASEIDRHYTIGVIASGAPASVMDHISIKVPGRASARVTTHQINLTATTQPRKKP